MKTIVVVLISLFAFAKAHTVVAQDSTQVVRTIPRIMIKAPIGKLISFGDKQVKLIRVIEDSRCPEGTTCIWAGQVKALVGIYDPNGALIKEEEITFKGASGTVPLISWTGTSIVATKITPYPSVAKTIQPEEYVLLLNKVSN